MIDIETLSTILFFSIVAVLIIRDRKNIEFKYGLVIRRIKRSEKFLDRFVNKHKKIIRWTGNLAIVIGIITCFIGLYFLITFTISLRRAFGIVLPSVAGIEYPRPIVSIPFWYWLIGIFVVIVSHESMHAIFSRLEKVRIRDFGVILFLILPIGAFVDPDMNQVKKLKLVKKLRIFFAGSFGNFLVAFFVILLTIASIELIQLFVEEVGIKFTNTIKGTPAYDVGLSGIIYQVNNHTIKNKIDFMEVINQTKPGDNLTIKTTKGTFNIRTIEHPDIKGRAFIGISGVTESYKYKLFFRGLVPDYVIESLILWSGLLYWLFMLNISVGIANLLPMKPFDGGYVFEEFFNIIFKKRGKTAIYITSIITISLLLINLFAIGFLKIILG
jgi:membrane-associated protease RseP (regulator of RpoE activity)